EAKALMQRLGNAVMDRRTQHPVNTAERYLGALKLNPTLRQAWWKGQALDLTKTQFTLLLQITAQPGRRFNYAELYAACTGDHIDPALAGQKLKTHVHNLRKHFKKIDTVDCPIVSKRGEGLAWQAEAGTR